MVFFNHATRQMTVKIVYYGPGLCGKTTNLNTIYGKTSQKARGEMVSLNTETDRTLFFDLLPMDVGMVGGFKTKLQLYTVPGQVFYNSTRKLVLKGVDGVVFVVDSQTPMLDACKESYQNLQENLRELGLDLAEIPKVFQWNKRDLRNIVSVGDLEAAFNYMGAPSFQSVASDGTGVFETLRGITKVSLAHIKTHVLGESRQEAAPVLPPPPSHEPVSAASPLTLSDLPSITDLLDMEGSSSAAAPSSATPLPDEEDDSGIFIEAPVLPEPPAATVPEPEVPVQGGPAFPVVEQGDLAFLETVPEAAAEPVAPEAPPEPVPERPPAPARGTAKPAAKADPLAALASLKLDVHKPAAKPKPLDHKDAISSLLGELTLAGRLGGPSVLRLEVSGDVDGQDLEVVVQVRSQGQILAEGQIQRPAPGKGSTSKLSVELKRS